ncbi:Large-conductance mechanosensitive channel [Chlamydiales bacterium SCGC AG-110-P3]|nr:Large-conductance mechanosensitive channel [Chlamydiales bacterium SCGC AG-110-P3]
MSLINDFKEFAVKGNAVDMAVGIIVGGAFGKVITSLVNDVIMPPIGMLLGSVDFSNLFFNLGETAYSTLAAAEEAGAPILKYGAFIQSTVDFLIVAFAIFMVIRGMNSLRKSEKEEKKPDEPSDEVKLLQEIRDGLKK